MEDKERYKRLKVVALVMVAFFLFLAGRLWQLQVVKGEVFAELAAGNRIRRIRIAAPRGRIYDRQMQPLVTNRASFTVAVVPDDFLPHPDAVNRLADILGMTREELLDVIKQGRKATPPYEAVRVKRGVDARTVVLIEENRGQLPGVRYEEEPERVYPHENLASHVLGNLRLINSEELAALKDQGYRGSDLIGETGIESYYEHELRGKDGARQVEVNALGRPISELGKTEPVPGNDLVLTIDAELQAAAEKALTEHLAAIRQKGEYDPKAGVVIVLEVESGEILAMTSKPDFNPNLLTPGRPERGEYYRQLITMLEKPLLNRATRGLYSPGSTFKPVTAIAALEMGVATPQEVFHADGYGPFAGIKCWALHHGLSPHGDINMVQALGYSCNDYFWEMGLRVTIDGISQYARKLGFGTPTGLRLDPGEKVGILPTREWKRLTHGEPWYPGDTTAVAIGQGYLTTTPIRVATYWLTLASRGRIMRPRLVKRILAPTGEVLVEYTPEVTGYVRFSRRTWQTINEGLKAVTSGDGTAAKYFRGFPIEVAGKTGSIELGGGQAAHGWFAAYAPADDPEIVVVALAENSGGGASGAAPIVRRVLEYYFQRKAAGMPEEN